MSYRRLDLWSVGLLALAVLAGCGPGNPLGREAVSGRVTLDGTPLEFGNISFDPVARSGGVRSGALITDGEYSMDTLKGLPPGKYKVRIFAAEANPPDMKAPDGGELPAPAAELPGQSLIPPEYNVQSDIVREVTAGGNNRFDFEVKTQ
jgi:hypothetical protein